jgi:HD-like signal output (HDOD) protein/signal transduction histidine kinase
MYSLPEPIRHAIESGRAPSPPQILLRLLQLVDDDGTTMTELARLVEQDPGLCTRVLTAANSSAIRRGKPFHSIEGCLMALGTRLVRSIATCLSVQSLFDERKATRTVDLSAFWSHSLLVAELSRSLATATGYHRPDEAYLAGLLHDVGELLLLSALGEPYLQVLAVCSGEATLAEMETENFGVHHGEVGTWLADQWHLDSPFADGILFHHLPAEQILTAAPLPQVVWLAHMLAGDNGVPEELVQVAGQMFADIDKARLSTLCDQAEQRMCVIADAIGIAAQDRTAAGGSVGLPRVRGLRTHAEAAAGGQLADILGNKALLQPLQRDLFELDDATELFLALRESLRILFELNHVAFLLCDPLDGRLTGKDIGGQPAIFAHVQVLPEAHRSLAAVAALRNVICSSFDREPRPADSLLDLQFARAFSSKGLLCIPMLGNGSTVGVIVAGLSAGEYSRLGRRLPCLVNFGRMAGFSLENWRQTQRIREQTVDDASARFTRQARRIVHEAGNPLTIIKGYLRILDGKLPPETDVRRELTVLGEEIERVSTIVRRMSEIPQILATEPALDIGDLLRELLTLYRETLFDAKGIAVETVLPGQAIPIACDRDSIKQILLNLLKNASEALSRGQRIRLLLSDDVVHQGRRFAELRIEDNGPGMGEAAIDALHRPAAGRIGGARGIGLSIVGTLTQRLGIPVTCRSKPGLGTMISLLLPTPTAAESRASDSNTRHQTISSPDTSQE